MSSPVFDQPHLAEIGAEYERFVGAYFEIIHGCFVIYHGRMLGEEDGGIDLIAVNQSKTYLVQCKNRYRSLIHENTVNQLGGAARSFAQKYPEARNITPIVFTTTDFDAQAQFAAEANNVQLRRMSYERKTVDDQTVLFNEYLSTEGHHSPTYDLPMPADYSHFVSEALLPCAPSPAGRHAAPEPGQTVSKPGQTVSKPGQTVSKPEQTVQKLNQTTSELNQTTSEPIHTSQASLSSPSVNEHPEQQPNQITPETAQPANKSIIALREEALAKHGHASATPKYGESEINEENANESTIRQKRSKLIRTHLIILLLELCEVFSMIAYLVPIAAFFAAVFLFEFFTGLRLFETVPSFVLFPLFFLVCITGLVLANLCREKLKCKIKQKESELP